MVDSDYFVSPMLSTPAVSLVLTLSGCKKPTHVSGSPNVDDAVLKVMITTNVPTQLCVGYG